MKLTKQEKSWILYDVANSAFTLLLSTTIPIYFRSLASSQGVGEATITSHFSLFTSLSVLVVAILAPIMGSFADHKSMKKRLFSGYLAIAILSGIGLSIATKWEAFLLLLVIARIGYSLCNVFYDSMLTDVTTDERMDTISGAGFAWGYIGSAIPFMMGLVLVLFTPFGLTAQRATQISFLIAIVWWTLFTIPLLKNVKQNYYRQTEAHEVRNIFKRLAHTLKKIVTNRPLFLFMVAYFFYIDGVNTIITQSTNFGGEVGIESNMMIVALLVTQFVAFPFAILSGKLAKRFGSLNMIKFYIAVYMVVAIIGFFLSSAWQFWVLAIMVGMCQGGIQALSRSYFGQLVPKDSSNEYFGFFDIFGKFAEFFGPILIALSAQIMGTSRYGILGLIVLFLIGIVLLNKVETKQ